MKDARCIVPPTILAVVRVVVANWSLRRLLEDAIREQTWTSSSATVAPTFILFPLKLFPLKRRSQRVAEFPVAHTRKEKRAAGMWDRIGFVLFLAGGAIILIFAISIAVHRHWIG
jgi:hypothetical protein